MAGYFSLQLLWNMYQVRRECLCDGCLYSPQLNSSIEHGRESSPRDSASGGEAMRSWFLLAGGLQYADSHF